MKFSSRHYYSIAFSAIVVCAFSSVSIAAEVKIQILSATVKDKKIAGANVILQRNGEASVTGVTNPQGLAVLNTGFVDDREKAWLL